MIAVRRLCFVLCVWGQFWLLTDRYIRYRYHPDHEQIQPLRWSYPRQICTLLQRCTVRRIHNKLSRPAVLLSSNQICQEPPLVSLYDAVNIRPTALAIAWSHWCPSRSFQASDVLNGPLLMHAMSAYIESPSWTSHAMGNRISSICSYATATLNRTKFLGLNY